jgi:hypothetical protein
VGVFVRVSVDVFVASEVGVIETVGRLVYVIEDEVDGELVMDS